MIEPFIYHIKMVEGVVPAEIVSNYALHLIGEGEAIEPSLLELNGESVGPAVNEE
jgi:hypothetical protein